MNLSETCIHEKLESALGSYRRPPIAIIKKGSVEVKKGKWFNSIRPHTH